MGKMGGASQEERTEEKELSHEEEAALERSRYVQSTTSLVPIPCSGPKLTTIYQI